VLVVYIPSAALPTEAPFTSVTPMLIARGTGHANADNGPSSRKKRTAVTQKGPLFLLLKHCA
jgi:hypothetical protein